MLSQETQVIRPRLFRKEGRFKTTGITEGRFVVHFQGCENFFSEIHHVDSDMRILGYECFQVLVNFEQPRLGSAIYRVRPDGSLLPLDTNYDSGD